MTPEEQDVQVRLGQLQTAIAKFNKERLKTEEYARGLKTCRVPREQVAATINAPRDHRSEEEAARQLADLRRLMLGREPTASELASGVPQGPPAGLGNPLIIAGIAGGAWVLVSLFNYLAEHEARIQRELNPSAVTSSDVIGSAQQWIVPALVVGGLVVGGYYLFKPKSTAMGWLLGGSKKPKPRAVPLSQMTTRKMPPREDDLYLNPEDEDEPEDDEDEDEDADDGGEEGEE